MEFTDTVTLQNLAKWRMEDQVHQSKSHAFNLLQRMKELRDCKEKRTCDVVVKCGEKEIAAHKIVLAAASPYFDALFYGGFNEAEMCEVLIDHLDSVVVETILDYCYTGYDNNNLTFRPSTDYQNRIVDVEEEVEHLLLFLEAAHYFQMEQLVSKIEKKLFVCVNVSNCLILYKYSLVFNLRDVEKIAIAFIRKYFNKVMQQSEFLDIKFDLFKAILSDLDIIVDQEADILEAILRWISGNPSEREYLFPELIDSVDLYSISLKSLLKNNKEKLLECQEFQGTNKIQIAFKKILEEHPKSRKSKQFLIVGYVSPTWEWGLDETVFDFDLNHWTQMKTMPFGITPLSYHSDEPGLLFTWKGFIYRISALLGDIAIYNPKLKMWELQRGRLVPQIEARSIDSSLIFWDFKKVLVYKDKLVVIYCRQSSSGRMGSRTCISIFDIETFRAIGDEKVLNSSEQCSVSSDRHSCQPEGEEYFLLGSSIYQIGGKRNCSLTSNPMNTNFRRFNLKTMQSVLDFMPAPGVISFKEKMGIPRSHITVAVFDNKVYLIGGKDLDSEPSTSVECYDPYDKKWIKGVASLNSARVSPYTFVINDKIWAVGGDSDNSIENYDIHTNKWTVITKIECVSLKSQLTFLLWP